MLWSPSRRLWLPRLRRGALGLGLGLSRGQNVVTPALDYPTRWGAVSHWRLEEASGNRVDQLGSQTLTDNNTVTSGVALFGAAAAQFTAANLENLSHADDATLSVGDLDFGISLWANFDSAPGSAEFRGLVSKMNGGGLADTEFWLDWSNTVNRLRLIVSDGASYGELHGTTYGIPATGVWTYIQVWHDSVLNTLNLRVNDGATDSMAWTTGMLNTASSFFIGRLGGLSNSYMDGRIQAVTLFKSPPGGIAGVAAEISSRLYNGGAGRAYPWS